MQPSISSSLTITGKKGLRLGFSRRAPNHPDVRQYICEHWTTDEALAKQLYLPRAPAIQIEIRKAESSKGIVSVINIERSFQQPPDHIISAIMKEHSSKFYSVNDILKTQLLMRWSKQFAD